MKIMSKFVGLAVLVLGVTCTYAASDSQAYDVHQGSYVEANVGTNAFYLGVFSTSGDTITNGTNGFGASLAYGYQPHPGGTAYEIGYVRNEINVTEESDQNSTIKLNGDLNVNTIYTAFRWEVPIGDKFAFIPKVGLMFNRVSEDKLTRTIDGQVYTADSGFSEGLVLPYVSLGAAYAITPKVSIMAQYQGFVIGIIGAGLLGAGVDVHF